MASGPLQGQVSLLTDNIKNTILVPVAGPKWDPLYLIPNYLNNYQQIVSPATKDKQIGGRCKGGIMLLYNENFKMSKVIDITDDWIFCELTHITGKKLITGCVYLPPNQTTGSSASLHISLERNLLLVVYTYPQIRNTT